MKKAEAISILATSVRPREPKDRARYDEAVKMAIEALKCSETPKSSERTAETAQNAQDEDLISRKAAIESIRECAEVAHDNYEGGMEQGYLNAIECVEEEPSAQPEIIRCKDCKHWRFDHTCREHSLVSPMMANEFCSRAERREG